MKSIQGTQVERGASKGMTWGGGGNKGTLLFYRLLGCNRIINYFLENKKWSEIQRDSMVLFSAMDESMPAIMLKNGEAIASVLSSKRFKKQCMTVIKVM